MKVYILTVGYRYEDETFDSAFSSFVRAKEYLKRDWPTFTVDSEDDDSGYYKCGNLEMSIYSTEVDPQPLPLHKE